MRLASFLEGRCGDLLERRKPMAGMVNVKVLRAVGGFEEGDTRELAEADAKRLAGRGVVRIIREKAEPAPLNKMEPALENKAAKAKGK